MEMVEFWGTVEVEGRLELVAELGRGVDPSVGKILTLDMCPERARDEGSYQDKSGTVEICYSDSHSHEL